jgi:nitroreductase
MLNDRSSALALLRTRRSGKPRELVGPGPSGPELEEMLKIAARVPDHGKLSPWRFVVVGDDQRDAFALLLRRALAEEDECAPPARHEKADQFAHHAGALVVLVSSPTQGHKIPVWEQELSSGAAAMNLLLGAHAMGYVGGWVTGWYAYSAKVNAAFCDPGERIAGFVFIGTPGRDLDERPRPDLRDVVRHWQPPGE